LCVPHSADPPTREIFPACTGTEQPPSAHKKARILRDTGESASLSITSHAALILLLPK